MNAALRRRVAIVVCCLLLLTFPKQAKADDLKTAAIEIIVGIVAVTAVITVGIVVAVRHKPSITGCTMEGPDGLVLRNESDKREYVLTGDLASLIKGQRVRVSGSKKTTDAGVRQFRVLRVTKNLGVCPVQPATP